MSKIPEKLKEQIIEHNEERGFAVSAPPNNREIMNKINEIIDYLESVKEGV